MDGGKLGFGKAGLRADGGNHRLSYASEGAPINVIRSSPCRFFGSARRAPLRAGVTDPETPEFDLPDR